PRNGRENPEPRSARIGAMPADESASPPWLSLFVRVRAPAAVTPRSTARPGKGRGECSKKVVNAKTVFCVVGPARQATFSGKLAPSAARGHPPAEPFRAPLDLLDLSRVLQ